IVAKRYLPARGTKPLPRYLWDLEDLKKKSGGQYTPEPMQDKSSSTPLLAPLSRQLLRRVVAPGTVTTNCEIEMSLGKHTGGDESSIAVGLRKNAKSTKEWGDLPCSQTAR
ncbi:hypothetical protein OSTOST_03252, partial [Ostertagia ostertagi]